MKRSKSTSFWLNPPFSVHFFRKMVRKNTTTCHKNGNSQVRNHKIQILLRDAPLLNHGTHRNWVTSCIWCIRVVHTWQHWKLKMCHARAKKIITNKSKFVSLRKNRKIKHRIFGYITFYVVGHEAWSMQHAASNEGNILQLFYFDRVQNLLNKCQFSTLC